MELRNKIAVITGAASGMGAATAKKFSELGARVVLLDRDYAQAQKLAQALNAHALECDVTNKKNAEEVFQFIHQEIGILSVCVNCAGICPGQLIVSKEGEPMPLDDYSNVIEVNLIGTFNIMRLAAAGMRKAEGSSKEGEQGVIINTASIAATEGQIGQVAYSASKGGVSAMTLPAARELARYGIRVVTIAPGLVDTPMLQGLPSKVREHLLADIPFPKRFAYPEEYALLAAHIVANPVINGTVIRLDGALRMAAK